MAKRTAISAPVKSTSAGKPEKHVELSLKKVRQGNVLTAVDVRAVLAAVHGEVWVDMFVLDVDDYLLVASAAVYKSTHSQAEWKRTLRKVAVLK